MTGISDDVAIILKDAASGYFSLQPGVQGWQGRPCDPEQGTRARHSRFGTAWGSPIGQSGGGLHFQDQVNHEVVQDLGDGEEECVR